MEVLIKNKDEASVLKNYQQIDVSRDEIILNNNVLALSYPVYDIKMIASFTTTPIDIIDGDKASAFHATIHKIDFFRKSLTKMSALPAAKKLPFSILPPKLSIKPVLNQAALDKSAVSIVFRGFENTYQSVDALYLDKDVSQVLFGISIYNIYREMKYLVESLPKKFPKFVSSGEVKIFRKISAHQVDEYISQEVQQKVRQENYFFQETLEQNGFLLRITPQYMDYFFGGKCDTQAFVSKVWKEFALGKNNLKA